MSDENNNTVGQGLQETITDQSIANETSQEDQLSKSKSLTQCVTEDLLDDKFMLGSYHGNLQGDELVHSCLKRQKTQDIDIDDD